MFLLRNGLVQCRARVFLVINPIRDPNQTQDRGATCQDSKCQGWLISQADGGTVLGTRAVVGSEVTASEHGKLRLLRDGLFFSW